MRRASLSPGLGEQFRLADLGGRLAHGELPAAADLTAPSTLQHVPIDPVGRRDVLVTDLVSHIVLIGAGREQRRDARVPQRVRRDLLADRRKTRIRPLPIRLFERGRDHVPRDRVARPALAAGVDKGRLRLATLIRVPPCRQ
jgi:hypothetical protein